MEREGSKEEEEREKDGGGELRFDHGDLAGWWLMEEDSVWREIGRAHV